MGVVDLSCGLHYVYYEWAAMHECCGFVMWVALLCIMSGQPCMGVVDLSCGLHYVYYEWAAMHGCCGFVMWVALCVL